jgi:hypothetical protein
MRGGSPLDVLPLWGLFLATVALVLVSMEAGLRLGRARRARAPDAKEGQLGSLVGALLGLLAFLLAFTFGVAANRFDTRRGLVFEEANVVRTTWLRADLVPEPHRTAVRTALREYVEVRIEAARTGDVDRAARRSAEIHQTLWTAAVAVGEQRDSELTSLFIGSLNETIDLHGLRLAAVRGRVPTSIWMALYAVAVLAMLAMGFHAGVGETGRSIVTLGVAVAFSCVMWLIADLDRAYEGTLRVSQRAMEDLRASMGD